MKEISFPISKEEGRIICSLYEKYGGISSSILQRKLKINKLKSNWIVQNIRTYSELKGYMND